MALPEMATNSAPGSNAMQTSPEVSPHQRLFTVLALAHRTLGPIIVLAAVIVARVSVSGRRT
jgi:hypothetical protein